MERKLCGRARRPAFTPPCKCQLLCKLKAFRQAHEEKCRTVEAREMTLREEIFCTDSEYEGEWRKGFGMEGYGVYTFPHGVIYEGEFHNGTMHGQGELKYKTASGTAAVKGQWKKGTMIERTIIFDDVLEYDEHDWKYCRMPDRRFAREYEKGLLPAGKSYQTAHQPTRKVPVGYYDTDDGFYDVKRKMVYEHDELSNSTVCRAPSCRERKWIHDNCRQGAERLNCGPVPYLYENFVEPTLLLEPDQPPASNTRFPLKSELYEIMEEPQPDEIHDVKENTMAAVPTELLLT